MGRASAALITVVLVVGAFAPAAVAQRADLARAIALYQDADFPAARVAFESVLGSPTLDRTTAGEAHRYLATIGLVLGERAVAEQHARAAVALSPETAPARGAPEEAEPMFRRAREALAGDPLRLTVTPVRSGRGVSVRLRPDVPALTTRLELRCDDGARSREAHGAPPAVSLDLDGLARPVACIATASNDAGAHLLRTRIRIGRAPERESVSSASPWPWIAAGAGAIAVAAVVLVVVVASGGANDDAPPSFGPTIVVGWR